MYTLLVTLIAVCALGATALAASPRRLKISATWDCCGSGGAALQFWKITESSSGTLSGVGYTTTTLFATVTGRVRGRRVTVITTYNSFDEGYVAKFVGRIAIGGRRMSGTWTSNAHQGGTWKAIRGKATAVPTAT